MTATRLFLGLSVLVWLPYGIYLSFVPEYLGEIAGLVGHSQTGVTEIRAMYGGLQAAIGVLCGVALLRPGMVGTALTMLAFLTGGLATARLLGIFLDGGASTYTLGALAFEVVNASIAYSLSLRHGRPSAVGAA